MNDLVKNHLIGYFKKKPGQRGRFPAVRLALMGYPSRTHHALPENAPQHPLTVRAVVPGITEPIVVEAPLTRRPSPVPRV